MLLTILFCLCLGLLLLLLDVAQVFQMPMFWCNVKMDQSSQVSTVQEEQIQNEIHNMKGCSQREKDRRCIYIKELKITTDSGKDSWKISYIHGKTAHMGTFSLIVLSRDVRSLLRFP